MTLPSRRASDKYDEKNFSRRWAQQLPIIATDNDVCAAADSCTLDANAATISGVARDRWKKDSNQRIDVIALIQGRTKGNTRKGT